MPAWSSRSLKLIPREWAVCFEGTPDHLDATIPGFDRDALLRQPPLVASDNRRSGQRVQPRIVVAPDQVEGAAVDPGENQRAIHRERPLDVGNRESGGSRADGEPEPPLILSLNGQETLDDGEGVPGRGSSQQLCSQALGDHRIDIRLPRSPGRHLATAIRTLRLRSEPCDGNPNLRRQSDLTSVSAGIVNFGTFHVWANRNHGRSPTFRPTRARPGRFAQTRELSEFGIWSMLVDGEVDGQGATTS